MTPTTFSFAGVGLGVRRALARVPLAGLRRRVVARLVGDVVVAGLPVLLLEEEADRLDDLRSSACATSPGAGSRTRSARPDRPRPRTRSRCTTTRAAPRCHRVEPLDASVVPPSTLPRRRRRRSRPRRARARRRAGPEWPTSHAFLTSTAFLLLNLNDGMPRGSARRRGDLQRAKRRSIRANAAAFNFECAVRVRSAAPRGCQAGYDRRRPKWRNWQTRRTQNPVPFGECGFDSHLRHRRPR